ncbi:TatD family hydrolase [Stetteria hydrogenophila]
MHVHLYEFSRDEVRGIIESDPGIVLVSVSEDVESFQAVLSLHEEYPDRVVPCVGFHPWNIGKEPLSQVDELIRMAYRSDVACVGEVGLDKKFVPETWETQVQVFGKFVDYAVEVGGFLNIHAPGAWRETLSILADACVERAMFHWYTGPRDLMYVIGEAGLKVSLNPALKIQRKHLEIAREAPLGYIVLESDGPYNYRGLRLTPLLIREAVGIIARERGVSEQEVLEAARANSERLLHAVR